MNAISARDINQSFDLVAEVSRYVQLKKIGAYYEGHCPMCGGDDRFQIKPTATGDIWICRHCAPPPYHSAIDFIMHKNNCDFREAMKILGAETSDRYFAPKPVQKPTERVVQATPSAEWQEQAWQVSKDADMRLTDDVEGLAGREYLLARGISVGMMNAFLLGYDPAVPYWDGKEVVHRPAISIPHIDGKTITAIKYRFIDGQEKRFTFRKDSKLVLFGLQYKLPTDDTLLFVEGELNAISVSQMMPKDVTVLSSGAETASQFAIHVLGRLAMQYRRVIVWMDDPEKAKRIRDGIGRKDAVLLQSKTVNGFKWDANQFLQAGLLDQYLTKKLSVRCLYEEQ